MINHERIHRRRPFAAALAAACVALVASPAAAQDPPPPLVDLAPPSALPPSAPPPLALPPSVMPPPSAPPPAPPAPSARTLGGLTFITPFLIDSAFPQSHLNVGVEVGRRWDYGVVFYPSATSPPFQYDQSVTIASQYLSLGLAVSDRVELGVDASYTSQLSSDLSSSLVFGAKSAWTLRPGLRVQLVRSSATGTQLGLHLYGDFAGDSKQSPAIALGAIEASPPTNCSGELTCALSSTPSNAASTTHILGGAGATLSLAQAISSTFGLQTALGLEAGYRSTNGTGSTPLTFHVGLAPSLDFGPKVPLAIMAEYLLSVTAELPTDPDVVGTPLTIQHGVAGGVYYTGRRNLAVGALFTATFATQSESFSDGTSMAGAPSTAINGQVTARYFF